MMMMMIMKTALYAFSPLDITEATAHFGVWLSVCLCAWKYGKVISLNLLRCSVCVCLAASSYSDMKCVRIFIWTCIYIEREKRYSLKYGYITSRHGLSDRIILYVCRMSIVYRILFISFICVCFSACTKCTMLHPMEYDRTHQCQQPSARLFTLPILLI